MIESINQAGGGGGGTVDTITAGTGISVDATNPANPIITNTSLNTDETAKVSSNDTTAGYLNGKLVAGSNVTLTENNNGGNETLTIAATVPVTSVNTKTGAVTLTNTDVGAAATSHTHAASDITSGVIATARLASSGTASSTTFLRGDQTWASISAGPTFYTVTANDVENTTTETTVLQWTIPANTWSDGQIVVVEWCMEMFNNTGGNQTATWKVGGTGITELSKASVTFNSTSTIPIYRWHRLWFVRDGAGLWYPRPGATNSQQNNAANDLTATQFISSSIQQTQAVNSAAIDTSVDFTTDITIYIKCKFDAASASLYIRNQMASVYKIDGTR